MNNYLNLKNKDKILKTKENVCIFLYIYIYIYIYKDTHFSCIIIIINNNIVRHTFYFYLLWNHISIIFILYLFCC